LSNAIAPFAGVALVAFAVALDDPQRFPDLLAIRLLICRACRFLRLGSGGVDRDNQGADQRQD
jgi:hypothetical protein